MERLRPFPCSQQGNRLRRLPHRRQAPFDSVVDAGRNALFACTRLRCPPHNQQRLLPGATGRVAVFAVAAVLAQPVRGEAAEAADGALGFAFAIRVAATRDVAAAAAAAADSTAASGHLSGSEFDVGVISSAWLLPSDAKMNPEDMADLVNALAAAALCIEPQEQTAKAAPPPSGFGDALEQSQGGPTAAVIVVGIFRSTRGGYWLVEASCGVDGTEGGGPAEVTSCQRRRYSYRGPSRVEVAVRWHCNASLKSADGGNEEAVMVDQGKKRLALTSTAIEAQLIAASRGQKIKSTERENQAPSSYICTVIGSQDQPPPSPSPSA